MDKKPPYFGPKKAKSIFTIRNNRIMDNDKKMLYVLTLSDIAEGLGTIIEAMKLVSNGLDDVANLLRDTVNGETAE